MRKYICAAVLTLRPNWICYSARPRGSTAVCRIYDLVTRRLCPHQPNLSLGAARKGRRFGSFLPLTCLGEAAKRIRSHQMRSRQVREAQGVLEDKCRETV
ncbi:hypothetical protein E2C01_056223 [Portunus trituberculatus]|uniref:Uncharacterized protein n=1 Tax=Portunus trituberculatus TaxID=210409 RepID=A0A5B7GPU0_PORTR|nr:hypothetical protein [Portunus trituberculatus]